MATPDSAELAELALRSLSALEFFDVLARISGACASEPGRAAVLALRPAADAVEARQRTEGVAVAFALADDAVELPKKSFADLGETLERVARGGAASGVELRQVHDVLEQARALRGYVACAGPAAQRLAHLNSDPVLDTLAGRIDACLVPNGDVSDAASPALLAARVSAREAEREIRTLLKRLVAAHKDVLSGEYFAEREGRFVLPVRADAHRRVEGSVVGSSASGSTLFVEPRQVESLVTRLRVREAEIEREEARVLGELVGQVTARLTQVSQGYAACVAGDVLGALLYWGRATRSLPIFVAAEPRLDLKAARHPLLASLPGVVQNDLVLESGRALVVSGPNAGGKTVALKILGLVAALARTGIPVPCSEDSEIGFFHSILADIGDQQSLVHSLSTFSGHIQKLATILASSERGTLVLLDEALAGTDPEEGAALAGAVLEALTARGAAVAVTTHYERLKEQAAGPGAFDNACVGFEFSELRPTFKVTLGAFGPSSALLVAARHGLEPSLIARAKALLPEAAVERERVAAELESERQRLGRLELELTHERDELEVLRRQLEADRERMLNEDQRELRRETQRLMTEVLGARRELDTARQKIRGLQADPKALKRAEREVSQVAAKVALGGRLASGGAPEERTGVPEADRVELAVGDTVRVRSNSTLGTVISRVERGQVELRLGALRMKLAVRDVDRVVQAKTAERRTRAHRSSVPDQTTADRARRTTDNTLDLRGTRSQDAESCLDAFISRLLGQGEDVGFVLHGHGTGALRNSVREHLGSSRWVESVEPADKDEGGDAFTMFRVQSR